MSLDLGTAATVVELECRVNVPTRAVGVHFASCGLAVANDGVT